MAERGPLLLRAKSALPKLSGLVELSRAGVIACERHPQFATVMAYKGKRAAVAARLKELYGLSLPSGPRRATSGSSALIGLGPRTWLFERESGPALEPELSGMLADEAAITDQSDGYVILRLTGPHVRDVLAKGISIDFHDRVFVPGCAAATTCAHIGVILWRLEDANGCAVLDVAVFRSLARSLWLFIEESAAEFGLAVTAAAPS
jgi:methylglutamate dehydrogenase subunit D